MQKIPDEQIIEAFRRTRRPEFVAKELKTSRQNVDQRLMRIRLKGVDLPKAIRGRITLKERNEEKQFSTHD